jgi:hypothetical protein
VHRRTPLLFTLTALVALLGMAVCFAGGATATHPPRWKQTNGRIDSVVVGPACTRTTFAPIAMYSYSVHGSKYGGLSIGGRRVDCMPSFDSARAIAATRFPVGRAVVVYYDPYDPTRSIMYLDVSSRGHPYYAIGTLIVLLLAIAVWRASRRED